MSQELAPLVLPLFLLRIGESKTRVVHLGTYDEEVEKVHYALFLRCHRWGESLVGVYVVLNFFFRASEMKTDCIRVHKMIFNWPLFSLLPLCRPTEDIATRESDSPIYKLTYFNIELNPEVLENSPAGYSFSTPEPFVFYLGGIISVSPVDEIKRENFFLSFSISFFPKICVPFSGLAGQSVCILARYSDGK